MNEKPSKMRAVRALFPGLVYLWWFLEAVAQGVAVTDEWVKSDNGIVRTAGLPRKDMLGV